MHSPKLIHGFSLNGGRQKEKGCQFPEKKEKTFNQIRFKISWPTLVQSSQEQWEENYDGCHGSLQKAVAAASDLGERSSFQIGSQKIAKSPCNVDTSFSDWISQSCVVKKRLVHCYAHFLTYCTSWLCPFSCISVKQCHFWQFTGDHTNHYMPQVPDFMGCLFLSFPVFHKKSHLK